MLSSFFFLLILIFAFTSRYGRVTLPTSTSNRNAQGVGNSRMDKNARLRNWLNSHQRNCSKPIAFYQVYNGGGIGSSISESIRSFAWALSIDRVFVPSGQWSYVDQKDCPSQSWTCYFIISPCFTKDRLAKATPCSDRGPFSSSPMGIDIIYDKNASDRYIRIPFLITLSDIFDLPIINVWGALAEHLIQPNDFFLHNVQTASVEVLKSSIGLHVRSSDLGKGIDHRCRVPDDSYMDQIREIRERTGLQKVYVATDVLTRGPSHFNLVMNKNESAPNFLFYSADRHLVDPGKVVATAVRTKSVAVGQVTAEALADMLALSNCEYFIGSYSNWGSIISGLRSIKGLENSIVIYSLARNNSCDYPAIKVVSGNMDRLLTFFAPHYGLNFD